MRNNRTVQTIATTALSLVSAGVGCAQYQSPGATVYPTASVAADHAKASEAGVEMLKKGGNAVDAAVAASFALSVVRPYSCGIGGGGFMVIYMKERPRGIEGTGSFTTTINYRETAPGAMGPEFFEGDADRFAPTHGGKSVGVPGTVAGLLHALEKYGTLDRATVLAPAIRLAKEGFTTDQHYTDSSVKDDEVLPWYAKDATRTERFKFLWERYLFKGDLKPGMLVRVPEQARVLEAIARDGRDAFYTGEIARAIVRTAREDGGVLTLEDMAGFTVEERPALESEFRAMRIVTMPPPSSGGIVLAQAFEIFEQRWSELEEMKRAGGHNSAAYVHLVAEACKHGFADRARWMGDPNFVDVPVAALLAPAYTKELASRVQAGRVLKADEYGSRNRPAAAVPEDGGTSHLCAIDAAGNAVACTETVNLIWGSHLVVPEYGIVLNNTMDDFLTRTGRANAFGLDHADLNRPAPGKRPLSSMTPTIVLDGAGERERVRLIAGGAGGPRIISGTIQAALNVLLWDMPADAALTAPRFHHQWKPDSLDLEPALRGGDVEAALKASGHVTGKRAAIGNVQIIRRVEKSEKSEAGWQPASDPRKGGVPAGY